jgi:hypothetical protein
MYAGLVTDRQEIAISRQEAAQSLNKNDPDEFPRKSPCWVKNLTHLSLSVSVRSALGPMGGRKWCA